MTVKLSLLALLLCSPSALAQINLCVDPETGQKTFTDKPCPKHAEKTTVEIGTTNSSKSNRFSADQQVALNDDDSDLGPEREKLEKQRKRTSKICAATKASSSQSISRIIGRASDSQKPLLAKLWAADGLVACGVHKQFRKDSEAIRKKIGALSLDPLEVEAAERLIDTLVDEYDLPLYGYETRDLERKPDYITSVEWAWDKFSGPSASGRSWACRDIETGMFADDFHCAGEPKKDVWWPNE